MYGEAACMQLLRPDALKWCMCMCGASELAGKTTSMLKAAALLVAHKTLSEVFGKTPLPNMVKVGVKDCAAPGVGVGCQLNGQDRGVVPVHDARDGVVAQQEHLDVVLVCLRGARRSSCSSIRCIHESCIVRSPVV